MIDLLRSLLCGIALGLEMILLIKNYNNPNTLYSFKTVCCTIRDVEKLSVPVEYCIDNKSWEEDLVGYKVTIVYGADWCNMFLTDQDKYKVGDQVQLKYGLIRGGKLFIDMKSYKEIVRSRKISLGITLLTYLLLISALTLS